MDFYGFQMIYTVLDEEEGGTRRKEGRRNGEEGGTRRMKKLLKKMRNEKVAKGRIIGLAGPCYGIYGLDLHTSKKHKK